MREAFEEALVAGWEELEPGIHLPDEDDRHVVAAAVRGGAQGIITANAKDFPVSALEPLGLAAVHPDDLRTVSIILRRHSGLKHEIQAGTNGPHVRVPGGTPGTDLGFPYSRSFFCVRLSQWRIRVSRGHRRGRRHWRELSTSRRLHALRGVAGEVCGSGQLPLTRPGR